MPTIVIGSQIIDIPNSGADPNWSSGIIDAFEAIALQLQAIASPFDVAPRVQILTSDANVNLTLADASFPSGSVRSFSLYYTIYRTNDVDSLVTQGEVSGAYDTLNAVWILNDSFNGERQADGIPYQSFAMSGDDLTLSTVAMGGAYNSVDSTISFSAKTELTTE